MTTTSSQDTAVEPGQTVQPVDEHERWRGVALESGPVDATGNAFLRRRSRQLLWDLLRPYKGWLAVMVLVVLVENAARLSIPWLVQRGIDFGIPPLLAGGSGTALYETIGLMLGALVVQTISRVYFLRESGRVGQKVLLELRRRTTGRRACRRRWRSPRAARR